MDGYQLLSILRSEKTTRRIPVIASTANAMPSDREGGARAGFDGYITKPVDIAVFLEAVDRHLLP